jgi:putative Mg2+ transporter-C (MgtC) family protein
MAPIPLETDLLTTLVRLGVAVLLGGAVGLNRDIHNKPAGVRTHALVALGAALVTLTGLYLAASAGGDPSGVTRVIQGIITGIGFIGGGVILHRGDPMGVEGLTTAASIWVVAALGIACGAGYLMLALIAAGLVLAVLILGGPLERALHRRLARDPNE